MSFAMSFVIWTVTGGLAGWLAGRCEHPSAVRSYGIAGLVGAILGGFLWFPAFEVQPGGISILILIFNFLTFNLFAALFGCTAGFWVVHLVHERRKPEGGSLHE